MGEPVKLDFSKAQPIEQPVTLDFSKAQPIAQTPTAAFKAPNQPWTVPWLKEKAYQAADSVLEALPGVGATAGAIGGGLVTGGPSGGSVAIPGAIGGATLGGMAGDYVRQIGRRAVGFEAPQTPWEVSKSAMTEGALQGAIQGATEALPFAAGPLRKAATAQYERALAPTTKANKAITQDIVPQLIQRGEYGRLGTLEAKAEGKIAELSPELNQAYTSLQQASPKLPQRSATTGRMVKGTEGQIPGAGRDVMAQLESLKQSYMPGGINAQPQAVKAIEGVQDIIQQYGPNISPTNLRRLRQIFEDPVARAGGFQGADLSTNYTLAAQENASNAIRGILNKNPNIGELNKEISFWLDVRRVTSESALRTTGQQGGLVRVLSPMATGLAASTTGLQLGAEKGIEAGLATALTTAAYQIARTPAWRTASAVVKDRLAQALASGSVRDVAAIGARFGVAVGEATPQNARPANQLQE